MKSQAMFQIDPLTVSLKQLRNMVMKTSGMIPSVSELRREKPDALFCFEHGDTRLTVYRNGYCIYQDQERENTIAVDRCRQLMKETSDHDIVSVTPSELDNGPCLIPLLAMGRNERAVDISDYEMYLAAFQDSRTQPW